MAFEYVERKQIPMRHVIILSLAALSVACVPLLFVSIPPLYDYYFHVGRLAIIGGPFKAQLATFYDVTWPLIPNLAMDVIGAGLMRLLSVEAVARLLVVLAFGLLLTGTCVLYRAVHGRWSAWPLVSVLLLYNWMFAFGFMNYILGLGALLWCLAGWLLVRQRMSETAEFFAIAAFALVIYAFHFFALALFGLCVAMLELGRALAKGSPRLRPLLRRWVFVTVPFLGPVALMAASATGRQQGGRFEFIWWGKVNAFDTLMVGTGRGDWLFYGALIILAIALLGLRMLRIRRETVPAVAALALLFVALPFTALGSHFADLRLPIAALFLLTSFTTLEKAGPYNSVVAAFVALLFVLRIGDVALAWSRSAPVVDDYRKTYELLPPGGVLFSAASDVSFRTPRQDSSVWSPPVEHIASLALLAHPVLVAQMYLEPGHQPVQVRPPFQPVADYQRDEGGYHSRAYTPDAATLARWLAGAATVAAAHGLTSVHATVAGSLPDVPRDWTIVSRSPNLALLRWDPARP